MFAGATGTDAGHAVLEAALTAERAKNAKLEAALAAERAKSGDLERTNASLRASHERLRLELELYKRRLFVAKAERVNTEQLELEFAEKLRQLEQVAKTLGMPEKDDTPDGKDKRKPKGRRDLRSLPIEERRVEVPDPLFDQLVADGKAERIGFDESCKLAWQRGGMRRLVIARVKYRTTGHDGEAEIESAMLPKELLPRCLAAPSLLGRVLTEKYCDGLPLFRIEERFDRDGVPVDRGTMSRWIAELGGTFGSTVVEAMRKHALATAFCIATDATGIAVQSERTPESPKHQPCARGHYFVQVADLEAIFFEYTRRETSAAVAKMFEGFSGFVQADAKSVFNVLFALEEDESPNAEREIRHEVGCWVHCRRYFWESAAAKSVVAREALARIGRIFELDASWRNRPASDIQRLRDEHLRPHVDAFFAWARHEYGLVREQRGYLRKALGYATRHEGALRRFLDDGRLLLDNNRSELALRKIAVGRKAWLFVGSDEHAQSAGHIFTLIATARLHRLDPEAYLAELIRVLPHWPDDRYLELAPQFWLSTRARLIDAELKAEVGELTVPPVLAAAEQQSAAG
jgi:transposase